ncbi:hypothetical protein PG984_005757 [Apiospora sp. TS-2023a]
MADPLSVGASIIAFFDLTKRIVNTCKYCIEAIKDAPKDFQMIIGETTSLKAIIETLKASNVESLGLSVTIEACRRCLSDLGRLLPKPRGKSSSSSRRRKITVADLAWPMKESKARKLLSEVSQHKATLLLAISGDMAFHAGSRRPIPQLSTIKHGKSTMERPPHGSFGVQNGPSGSQGTTAKTGSYGVTAFRDVARRHNQDESSSFLRWIISQACRISKSIPSQLKDLHDNGCEPSLAELNNILQTVLSNFTTFYIVIDAVDESAPRRDLVALLATIALDQRFSNIRLLVTSRQYSDIENVFSGISIPISMSNTLVAGDIRQFIRNRLSKNNHLQRRPGLMDHVENSLVNGANGMFRWADCQLYNIEHLRTESQILSALQNLPADLAETYIRIFQQIPMADREFVRRTLIWLGGHADAPWHTHYGIKDDVLVSAVTHDLHLGEPEHDKSFYDIEYLRELCGCLITVTTSVSEGDVLLRTPSQYAKPGCGSVSLVTLAHYTVMEFLNSPFIHETDVSYFALPSSVIRDEFTESILRQAVNADPQACARIKYGGTSGHVDLMLKYCDPRRPHYSRFAAMQKFLGELDGGWTFYFIYGLPDYQFQGHPAPETAGEAGLLLNLLLVNELTPASHGMVSAGVGGLVQALLENPLDLGELLTTRLTITFPALSAFSYGQTWYTGSIVAILSRYTPKLFVSHIQWLTENYSERLNLTALLMETISCCSIRQSEEGQRILGVLVDNGADPNGPGCYLTPLKAAIYSGCAKVVRFLLAAGADPNFTGSFYHKEHGAGLPAWLAHSSKTPLQLLPYLPHADHVPLPDQDQSYMQEIEGLLLEYGAVENSDNEDNEVYLKW